jgi:hypothetical protein
MPFNYKIDPFYPDNSMKIDIRGPYDDDDLDI